MIKPKASTRLKPFRLTLFTSYPDLNLQKKYTEKVRYTLRTFLVVAMYTKKDPREREFFYTFFRAGHNRVAFINGGQFLQMVYNSARQGYVATLDITTSYVLEVHMFIHSIGMLEKTVQAKTLKCS